MPARQPAIAFIFVTVLLDVMGFGLVIPILPRLVQELQGGDLSSASHAVGWLGTLYAAMQFLFAPLLGVLSDRFGRRPVLLVSLFGTGLDFLVCAWAPTLAWFYAARILSGLTGANYSAAGAYIADVTPPERRAASFGLLGAAFGLGFIIGPVVGGLLGQYGLRLPFYAAAGVALLNWIYGFFVLPESLRPENRRPIAWSRSNPVGALLGLRGMPLVLGLTAALFVANVASFSIHSTWVLYTGLRFGWGPREVGISLAVVGLAAAIVQGGLAPKIIPRLGDRRSVLVGMAVGAASLAAYGMATEGWMIYVILLLGSVSGIAGAALQGIISNHVPADQQGGVQGALASVGSVSGIVAPLAGAGVFGLFVGEGAILDLPGASFFAAASLMLLALGLAVRSFRAHPELLRTVPGEVRPQD